MTRQVTDQMGRSVAVPLQPLRIVSLVPSQTELLFDLGCGDRLVGVTKFCVHPAEKVSGVERVGGTKNVDFEKIRLLNPDLVIANKEENDRDQMEELMKSWPVWISDISNLDEALQMIAMVGDLTGCMKEALTLSQSISGTIGVLPVSHDPLRAIYLIWRKPFMYAGNDTFIDDMMRRAGFINAGTGPRYPQLSGSQLQDFLPEVVLLSSEPYPFGDKHIAEIQSLCPQAQVMLVDGEMFSWYGSRLRYAAEYIRCVQKAVRRNK